MTTFLKTTAAALLVVFLGSGCGTNPVDPLTLEEATAHGLVVYQDPQGRFELRVPQDWRLAQATTDVQWFATLDSGEVTAKLSLFDETRPLAEVQTFSEEDRATQTVERFEERTVNGIPTLLREAQNMFGSSTTTYYIFEDSVVALVALYGESVSTAERDRVHAVFNSVQATNPSSR